MRLVVHVASSIEYLENSLTHLYLQPPSEIWNISKGWVGDTVCSRQRSQRSLDISGIFLTLTDFTVTVSSTRNCHAPIEDHGPEKKDILMLITTTPTVEGHPIQRYLGIVSGETISGVNVIKDITAGFRNFVGGRSASYEQEIQAAYSTAISEMAQRAESMGANAIVGVRVDYFTAGTDNGMLAAIANGTAVII